MRRHILLTFALVLVTGCPEMGGGGSSDVGPLEGGMDAGVEAGMDVGPDMGTPDVVGGDVLPEGGTPLVLGTDPVGDLTCTGSPKLDITSVECGEITTSDVTITIRMYDPDAPATGIFYSWFVRIVVSDDMGMIGAATVQEHDGVYDEIFEGVLDASNTTFAISDAFEISFDEFVVPPGSYLVLEAGVLETAGGSVCTERAPDMGTYTVCDPSATP